MDKVAIHIHHHHQTMPPIRYHHEPFTVLKYYEIRRCSMMSIDDPFRKKKVKTSVSIVLITRHEGGGWSDGVNEII